jgi:hypothetical protein
MAAETGRTRQEQIRYQSNNILVGNIKYTRSGTEADFFFFRGLRFSFVSIIIPVIHTHVSFMQHRCYMTDSVLKSTLLSILFTPVTKFE